MIHDIVLLICGAVIGFGPMFIWSILRPSVTVSPMGLTFPDTYEDPDMPSEAFNTALANLIAAKDAEKDKAVADALAAQPVVTDTGPAVDADDTAAIVAATPAA